MSASDLKLMRCMDELHMQYPFAGSRMMRDLLNRQGHHIGRRHTRTLMKKMGINALYCKPNLSQANQAHANIHICSKDWLFSAVIKCGLRI